MLKKILKGHIQEVIMRLYYRQDPDDIAKDLSSRGIIPPDQYEAVLESLKEIQQEFEMARIQRRDI